MKRYFTKPKAYIDEGEWEYHEQESPRSCTVHEPEDLSTFSGLYNAEGEPLYSTTRQPIGFLKKHE